MKTILVPVDFSAVTPGVMRAACQLAKLAKSKLVLLHVVQPPVVVDVYGLGQEMLGPTLSDSEQVTTRKLRTLIKQCVRQGVTVRAVQQAGNVVKEILATATRLKAAYIVLGSHGHGAAYDLIAGSTTNGVLRKSPCPVLVVPSKGKR